MPSIMDNSYPKSLQRRDPRRKCFFIRTPDQSSTKALPNNKTLSASADSGLRSIKEDLPISSHILIPSTLTNPPANSNQQYLQKITQNYILSSVIMCHSIIWYYALCQHQDQDASYQIACHKVYITNNECTEEQHSTLYFSLIGKCLECKLEQLVLRQSVFREWRREDLLAALNDAFRYSNEDGWTIDDSDAEELDMETWVSQSPGSFADRVENRETRASFHKGPARMPSVVQQASIHVSSVALVGYTDDYADDEEYVYEPSQEPRPQMRRRWRSWIPLPTRLVRNQQTPAYRAFITDDDMSDTESLLGTSKAKEDRRTWRSWIPLPVKKVSEQ